MSGPGGAQALRLGSLFCAGLAISWGLQLGSRPVLAYGLAQLALLLVLWRLPRLGLSRLRLRRDQPGAACEEDGVFVDFEVCNEGRLPLIAPEIEDRFPPDKVPRRLTAVYPLLPGRSVGAARYRGRCFTKRGPYVVGPATVRVYDPLGLFWAERQDRASAKLVVYPRIEPLLSAPPTGVSQAALPTGFPRRDPGDGELALGVRDYRAGDPLRRVHWPSTARRGRLVVQDLPRHRSPRVTLVLDRDRATLRGLGRNSTLELSIRTVAALAGHYLSAAGGRQEVALVMAGEEVPPARGTLQLARILELLAYLRPGETPLGEVLDELSASARPGQAVCVVLPDHQHASFPALLERLERLSALDCQVTAIVLDSASLPRLDDAPLRAGEHDQDRRSLEQAWVELRAGGIAVYVVPPEGGGTKQPLAAALSLPYGGRPRLRLTRADLRPSARGRLGSGT